ncbi:MAG: DNA/RNA non-specific endonuclease [Bacteroidota bacterium]
MSRQRWWYTLLLMACVVGFWWFDNYGIHYFNNNSNSKSETESPLLEAAWLPNSTTDVIVQHNHYTLSYSEPHEQAEWVAYQLQQSHLTYDDRERPYFVEDPKVATQSADWRNYKRSGYDRGHLCPAGDRRFSLAAYNETFYTSNISPQERHFNGGIWNRLELKVRQWCKRYGTLTVITGGVLREPMDEIGEEGVTVPKAFYKVVFRYEGETIKALAFLIPHQESKSHLKTFLVTLNELEAATGIDFFYKLPVSVTDVLEQQIDTSGWAF